MSIFNFTKGLIKLIYLYSYVKSDIIKLLGIYLIIFLNIVYFYILSKISFIIIIK